MFWIKIDLTDVPEAQMERTFTSYVWELAERTEGEEYERARYQGQALGITSQPPGYVAQIDWGLCRVCRNEEMTVKGLCKKCRGPLL